MAEIDMRKIGSKGGKARSAALTDEERKEIARHAVEIRWQQQDQPSSIPHSTHTGTIVIGDLLLPCAVLSNGQRVLSQRGVTKALGGKRGGAHWRRKKKAANGSTLPVFISAGNLAAFVPPSLQVALSQPIVYHSRYGKAEREGILATLLPEICNVWLSARRAEKLMGPPQEHIARSAEILLAGLANVGIVALVDEATGYQEVRDRLELHKILEAYISKELLPWSKRFPDEFYQQLFRLRGWEYSPPSPKRPKLVGKLTCEIVYEKLPPGILEELRNRNPVIKEGWRRHRHHQFLTEDIGHPHLEKHLVAVTTLMRASPSWGRFRRLLDKAFPMKGPQYLMPLDFNEDDDGSI